MRVLFQSRVRSVFHHKPTVRTRKDGDDVIVETEDRGWFVLLEGSYEAIHVGMEQPTTRIGKPIEPGMAAKVTLEIG